MVSHIRILAVFHILWNVVWLLSTAMMMVTILAMLGMMAVIGDVSWAPLAAVALVGTFFGFVFAALAIFGLVGGVGLLKGYRWSRIPLFISATISLASFPYGLALFGYTLVVLLDEDVRRELAAA